MLEFSYQLASCHGGESISSSQTHDSSKSNSGALTTKGENELSQMRRFHKAKPGCKSCLAFEKEWNTGQIMEGNKVQQAVQPPFWDYRG